MHKRTLIADLVSEYLKTNTIPYTKEFYHYTRGRAGGVYTFKLFKE